MTLKPGDIVISGALSKMLPIGAGHEFVSSPTGQPDLTVAFRRGDAPGLNGPERLSR